MLARPSILAAEICTMQTVNNSGPKKTTTTKQNQTKLNKTTKSEFAVNDFSTHPKRASARAMLARLSCTQAVRRLFSISAALPISAAAVGAIALPEALGHSIAVPSVFGHASALNAAASALSTSSASGGKALVAALAAAAEAGPFLPAVELLAAAKAALRAQRQLRFLPTSARKEASEALATLLPLCLEIGRPENGTGSVDDRTNCSSTDRAYGGTASNVGESCLTPEQFADVLLAIGRLGETGDEPLRAMIGRATALVPKLQLRPLATVAAAYSLRALPAPQLWAALLTAGELRLAEVHGTGPSAYSSAGAAAMLLTAATAQGAHAPGLFERAAPLCTEYLAGALFAELPAHRRASQLYALARDYARQGVIDAPLLMEMTRALDDCLSADAAIGASAGGDVAGGLRSLLVGAAHHLTHLGALRVNAEVFARCALLPVIEGPSTTAATAPRVPKSARARGATAPSGRSDFRACRLATQRFGVYAGVRAALLTAPQSPADGSALAEVARRSDIAAVVYTANRRAADVTVSDSQKTVFTRTCALAARRGWPAPRREAEVQCGFRADIVLTAKPASRLLPFRPVSAAAARVFRLHGDGEEASDQPTIVAAAAAAVAAGGGDAVASLLRLPGHSGIIIEVDGPSHFRSVAATEARAAEQWLADLHRPHGDSVGRATAKSEEALAGGSALDLMLAVHGSGGSSGSSGGGDRVPPSPPPTRLRLPAAAGARLGSLYRRWLLRAYGWLPVSICYEDYGAHVGFVSAARAEAFLQRTLEAHAEAELARLARGGGV